MSDTDSLGDLARLAQSAITSPFGGTLGLFCTDHERTILIDGNADAVRVTQPAAQTANADCTIRGESDVLLRILKGERALESAYVSGRITISGDMSVMARLEVVSDK